MHRAPHETHMRLSFDVLFSLSAKVMPNVERVQRRFPIFHLYNLHRCASRDATDPNLNSSLCPSILFAPATRLQAKATSSLSGHNSPRRNGRHSPPN